MRGRYLRMGAINNKHLYTMSEFLSLTEAAETCIRDRGAVLTLRKHMAASGLNDWADISRAGLYAFHDHLVEAVAPSTARTVSAHFRAVLSRFSDRVELPEGWQTILRHKAQKPLKTYLSADELGKLEKVRTHTQIERAVLREFLVSAYTGMRISDVQAVGDENLADGVLTYVSIKTGVTASVPLRPGIADSIRWIRDCAPEIPLASYNRALRRIAKRAGITQTVAVYKAGRKESGEKWRYLSSHSGRISFATNLHKAGVDIVSISQMMGHTSTAMTQRYIVPTGVQLSKQARAFFGL